MRRYRKVCARGAVWACQQRRKHVSRPFLRLPARPDVRLSEDGLYGVYRAQGYLPWCVAHNIVWVVTAGGNPYARLHVLWRGRAVRLFPLGRKKFDRALAVRFGGSFSRVAALRLARCAPVLCARITTTRRQQQIIAGLFLLLLLSGLLWPQTLLHGVVLSSALGFCIGMGLRLALGIGGMRARGRSCGAPPPPMHNDDAVPVYTVLVPLMDEAAMVPSLTRHLAALEYPRNRLDVKLIVEADDRATRQAAERYSARYGFSVVVVPPGGPRTKPKACNYALHFARGAFVVVFDAEDRPQKDQLRRAVAAFDTAPVQTACLQGRLTIDNAGENWLTTLFAIDYDIWFSVMLPGLARLQAPIPLGGTSNHFRTDILRRIGGWDPYNVTEDADLGMRLAARGYRVGMLDAWTGEEAPTRLDVWMRQRTRWLKGYMQTLLVYLRSPFALCRRLGLARMLFFLTLFGGTILSALLNPFLWIIFLAAQLQALPFAEEDPSRLLAVWSGGGLLLANGILIGMVFWSEHWRGHPWRLFYGLTMVVYWLLISVAAWRGVCQLLVRPHLWEKTPHGSLKRYATADL